MRAASLGGLCQELLLRSLIPVALGLALLGPGPVGSAESTRVLGSVGAGAAIAFSGICSVLVARGAWRSLEACGLAQQALLSGAGRLGLTKLWLGRALPALWAWMAAWLVLPASLSYTRAWSPAELLGGSALTLLFCAVGLCCGLWGAWLESASRPRPAMGLMLLVLVGALPQVLTLSSMVLPRAQDLASWLLRVLALATPLSALRPAWSSGPDEPWLLPAALCWMAMALLLMVGLGWALPSRATRGSLT